MNPLLTQSTGRYFISVLHRIGHISLNQLAEVLTSDVCMRLDTDLYQNFMQIC
jgi:hypothetical protein